MGGPPPPRIPPYIGVVDKKRGDNTIKKILGKIFDKLEVLLYLCGVENKKQTAVEWLVKQIENHIHHTIRIPSEYVEKAKEMEKQQIMMAVTDSWYMAKGSDFQELQAEQYYIEEYGGNK